MGGVGLSSNGKEDGVEIGVMFSIHGDCLTFSLYET